VYTDLLLLLILIICHLHNWDVLVLGFGIFTTKAFIKGEFILDYSGKLLDSSDADTLVDQTYLYYFQSGNRKYW